MGDVDEFFDIFFYNFSTCVMSWCTSWRDPSAFAESLCVDGPFFSDRVAFFFYLKNDIPTFGYFEISTQIYASY